MSTDEESSKKDNDEEELKPLESAETKEFEDEVLKDPEGDEYIRAEQD